MGPVGRVDGNQYGADLRRGELGHPPLVIVGGPDGDPVSLANSHGQERLCRIVHDLLYLAVRESTVLMYGYDRFVIGIRFGDPVQAVLNALTQQRVGMRSVSVGYYRFFLCHHVFGHFCIDHEHTSSQLAADYIR